MPALAQPAWLAIANGYLGTAEKKGPQHNAHVLKWWKEIGAPFKDDETPWCGAFVGGVLFEAGIKPVPGGASARAWLKLGSKKLGYGAELDAPAVGCVVIFWRGSKSGANGHVGFVVGKDQRGNLMVLGGNQGDAVTIKPFGKERVLGYRWPGVYPYPERFKLPVFDTTAALSSNEA